MGNSSILFSPFKIKDLDLKNRITMAPTYVGYANPDGTVSELTLDHYKEMASSGAAMIVVENAAINQTGSGSPFTIRADDDQFMEGLSQLATAIKDQGALAFQQINHAGKYAFSAEPLAPTGGPEGALPKEMELEDMDRTIDAFAAAASRVKAAGQISEPINCCEPTCMLCIKRAMSGKPVFCSQWNKERREAFLIRVGEKPEEVDQTAG